MEPSDFLETFNDGDKTIVRPSPGGRRRPPAAPPSTHFKPAENSYTDIRTKFPRGSNPLCAIAYPLISLVPKLRLLPYHHDINALQDQLIREMKIFVDRSSRKVNSSEHVKVASYFICSLIDETVLNTPWGSQSNWGHHSLSIRFHNEARGGERFFQILDGAKQQPERNLNLLELAYLCLSMGFKGRYRVAANGMHAIEQLRHDLYLLIQRMRASGDRTLSPGWRGVNDIHGALIHHIPVWVLAVVSGLLLMVIYLGYSYAINRTSDQVYKHIAVIGRADNPAQPVRTSKPESIQPDVAPGIQFERLLANEFQHNMVAVIDGKILRFSNSFPSGSDRIRSELLPALAKIAQELSHDNSHILVVGHSDDRPILSARFPSNWHLSQARAKNVAEILISSAPLQGRVRFEGHADSEPVYPNDSPQHRAYNRRVDIHIR